MSEQNERILEAQLSEIKKQSFWMRICGVAALTFACIALFLSVFLVRKVNALYDDVTETAGNLSKVSRELSEIDFKTMTEDVSTLVNDAEGSLSDTMEKIDAIDIDSLNQSIQELQQILDPISNFFGSFGR